VGTSAAGALNRSGVGHHLLDGLTELLLEPAGQDAPVAETVGRREAPQDEVAVPLA
jgi:hypothetical protein